MMSMGCVLGSNFLVAFLPSCVGNALFSLVRKVHPIAPPKDIKIAERKFKRSSVPQVEEVFVKAGN